MRERVKNYFIPHEGNDYKPHSLQKSAVMAMMVLVAISFTVANLQSIIWISSEWMVSTILPSVIVELTNDEREDDSLSAVRRSATLDAAAKLKAEHMAAHQYFAHYSPDGVSPWYWFDIAGYGYVHAGENLAIHFNDSDEVVDAWMDSPSHRANIMNNDYTEIGVGAVEGTFGGFKTVYVVQLFGTPAAPAVETESDPEPIVVAQLETSEDATLENEDLAVVDEEVEEESETPTTTPETPEEIPAQIAGSEELVAQVDDTEVTVSSLREAVVVAEQEVASSTEVAEASSTESDVAEVAVTDDAVILYSDFVSTSTGGVPATIEPDSSEYSGSTAPVIASIATKPQMVLQVIYVLIGLFVIAALVLSIFIEIRRQQPVQIAYSAGLMAVMAALFYVHIALTSGATIV